MADGKTCSVANCGYVTPTKVPNETEIQYKVPLLQLQMQELQFHHSVTHGGGGGQVRVQGVKAKMDPPKLRLGVDQQSWDQFITRWEIYKTTMCEPICLY